MKGSNVFKLIYLIFKWAIRVFLCLLPFVCLAAFAFDRIIVSEVRSACKLPVVDERQRRAIDQAFIFSWFHVARVGEIFNREHPRLSGIFTWHLEQQAMIVEDYMRSLDGERVVKHPGQKARIIYPPEVYEELLPWKQKLPKNPPQSRDAGKNSQR